MSSRTQTVDMSSTSAYKCKVPMLYVILRTRANLPRRLFEGGVYFTQRVQLCGVYLRAASIRRNTVCPTHAHLTSARQHSHDEHIQTFPVYATPLVRLIGGVRRCLVAGGPVGLTDRWPALTWGVWRHAP